MKNKQAQKTISRKRRIARVRATVKGTSIRPRLTVRRSLAHIYAQIIDDSSRKTLVAAQDADVETKGLKKTDIAAAVGTKIAERAKEKGITSVVFDRRDRRYHGRVQALADAARAGGLQF